MDLNLFNFFQYFTKTNIFLGIGVLFPIVFLLMYFTSTGKKIARSLWGKFESREEIKKFLFLAVIFFLIIGIYWALRPIKDSIFGVMVGVKRYQPLAKWLSVGLMLPLILFYNKLIDKYPRHKLFYILCSAYGIITLIFMGLFFLPSNQEILMHPTGALASPYNVLGWLWYFYVESFGSMIVALFWAFSSDITKAGPAKRGFPLIFMFGQLGNVLGPTIINVKNFNVSTSTPLLAILSVLCFLVAILLWIFMLVTPKRQLEGFEAAKLEATKGKGKKAEKEPGFLDGLKLLLRHKYLLGIYGIIMFYEVIVTMFDYVFKYTGKMIHGNEVSYSGFLSEYAVWTGIVSAICVFLGINNIQRKLGMTVSLFLMPIVVLIAFVALRVSGRFDLLTQLVFLFWVMVFSKAINYALNQPTLKQAYIPTTKESKYKAQSWIEMFGGRSSKGIGSGVNLVNGWAPMAYIFLSSTITLGIIGVWVFVAIFVAKTYNKAVKENKVIC